MQIRSWFKQALTGVCLCLVLPQTQAGDHTTNHTNSYVTNDTESHVKLPRSYPHNGMRMPEVEAEWGNPPYIWHSEGIVKPQWPLITVWDYGPYAVYFENKVVLHTVVRATNKPQPATQIAKASPDQSTDSIDEILTPINEEDLVGNSSAEDSTNDSDSSTRKKVADPGFGERQTNFTDPSVDQDRVDELVRMVEEARRNNQEPHSGTNSMDVSIQPSNINTSDAMNPANQPSNTSASDKMNPALQPSDGNAPTTTKPIEGVIQPIPSRSSPRVAPSPLIIKPSSPIGGSGN